MKKYLFLLIYFLPLQLFSQSATPVLWVQQPAISPDGQWIAFEYKGNIFKVSAKGGIALPLTINSAYNGYPVWSHDGKTMAFASDRNGNLDVFTMPADGGNARRLTFNSAKDIPYDFSADDRQVYFGTSRHDVYTSARFPQDDLFMKLYKVSVNGGRNLMVNSAGTEFAHFNKEGNRIIFQDSKGYENTYRKHHISPVTRDIWVYDLSANTYARVSDFAGEDREPVWGDGGSFYYLSERNGTQNVFRSTLEHPAKVEQLTAFTKNPVRNLSRAGDGTIVFTQGGRLYILQAGSSPKQVPVSISADFSEQVKKINVNDATEIAVSPNGQEIAFVHRGELFVSALDGSGTKKITNTPYMEQMINFSPDGRSLLYSVEKDSSWDICKASIVNKNEPYFYASTLIRTEPVISTQKDEFDGIYSPDGKKIAYLEERNIIRVYNLETKRTVTVLPEGMNYSYINGDQRFVWSPDGNYLLIDSSEGYAASRNIILAKADGTGKRINLTENGYAANGQQWGANGKMMVYASAKFGLTNLAMGWGQSDVYAMYFDRSMFDNFNLSKKELTLQQQMTTKDAAVTTSRAAGSSFPAGSAEGLELQYDLNPEALAARTVRLTSASALLGDFKLSPDGEKLFYIAKFNSGCDLWALNVRTHESKQLTRLDAGSASLYLSGDGKTIIILSDGNIYKVNPENGDKAPVNISTTMSQDGAGERAYIFEHAYNTLLKKFWDPKLQGVDWKYYHAEYQHFLPHINNNYDFQILLSEFLGELNSSHTGAVYRYAPPNADATAALGLLYDVCGHGKGLTVSEVLAGGPFDVSASHMDKGCVIDKIDGINISDDVDWESLLNNKAGRYTLVNFHNAKTSAAFQEVIKPIPMAVETNLLYSRWTRLMVRLTDSLSGGQVGYIHIRGMFEEDLRKTIDAFRGRNRGKKAIIIDTRFNTGGNLHDELTALLSEKEHFVGRPQGHKLLQDALDNGESKLSCVLMNEANYSDAFNFPYEYQKLGLGKLIGTPVAGTGTGVYWENQIDNTLFVGIPEMGLSWVNEGTLLENHQIEPDIKIYDAYDKILTGHDEQLEAAVKEMLKEIKK